MWKVAANSAAAGTTTTGIASPGNAVSQSRPWSDADERHEAKASLRARRLLALMKPDFPRWPLPEPPKPFAVRILKFPVRRDWEIGTKVAVYQALAIAHMVEAGRKMAKYPAMRNRHHDARATYVGRICQFSTGELGIHHPSGNTTRAFLLSVICVFFFEDAKSVAKSLAETIRVALCRSSASSPLLSPVTR